MLLPLTKCLWIKKKELYGLMFVKNGQKYEMFTKSITIYNEWKEILRRVVLVSDFHDEYNVTKQIG